MTIHCTELSEFSESGGQSLTHLSHPYSHNRSCHRKNLSHQKCIVFTSPGSMQYQRRQYRKTTSRPLQTSDIVYCFQHVKGQTFVLKSASLIAVCFLSYKSYCCSSPVSCYVHRSNTVWVSLHIVSIECQSRLAFLLPLQSFFHYQGTQQEAD